uniref:Schlafen like 1 n=1 Tax=Sphenodon punctatus TaxID=8508 RepID=A0A8D0GLQ5_SPHPU
MAGVPELAAKKSVAEATVEEAFPEQTHSYTLYIGNLNPKYSREVLCSMLKDILGTASIHLQRHDIEVVRTPRQAYAFVQVATEMSLECVLKQLLVTSDAEQDIVKELVIKGKRLDFLAGAPIEGVGEMPEAPSPSPAPALPSSQGPRPREPKTSIPDTFYGDRRACQGGTRSDSAIVRREIVGQEHLFYGAFLGSETRNVEFKRGGGEYLTLTLKHHVRKYTCAFLNSEGGSLFVGVEDSGFVHGVRCGHRDEDRVRLLIDSILKGFKPQVFPDAYTLRFIPVIKAEDSGILLKVIRLSVHPPKQQVVYCCVYCT